MPITNRIKFNERPAMIVAGRKVNDGFRIGKAGEIRLKVVEIWGDEVLIGVEAPEQTLVELDPPAPRGPGRGSRFSPNKKRVR